MPSLNSFFHALRWRALIRTLHLREHPAGAATRQSYLLARQYRRCLWALDSGYEGRLRARTCSEVSP